MGRDRRGGGKGESSRERSKTNFLQAPLVSDNTAASQQANVLPFWA